MLVLLLLEAGDDVLRVLHLLLAGEQLGGERAHHLLRLGDGLRPLLLQRLQEPIARGDDALQFLAAGADRGGGAGWSCYRTGGCSAGLGIRRRLMSTRV